MKHIWPEVSAFVLFVFIYIAMILLAGCSCAGGIRNMSDDWCDQQQPSQSWDQANLKKNDHGCPTAIYVAPNGNLEQC